MNVLKYMTISKHDTITETKYNTSVISEFICNIFRELGKCLMNRQRISIASYYLYSHDLISIMTCLHVQISLKMKKRNSILNN